MPATHADHAANVRCVLQERPILAAFALDRALQDLARDGARGLGEGLRVQLGEGTLDLDRWAADQTRRHAPAAPSRSCRSIARSAWAGR
jgi:hypothetical protein